MVKKQGTSIRSILDFFDRLPEPEKRELAAEIMRRTAKLDFPPLTDEDLVLAAEELFLKLDKKEAKGQQPNSLKGMGLR